MRRITRRQTAPEYVKSAVIAQFLQLNVAWRLVSVELRMERYQVNAYQKEIEMRELTMSEIGMVSGAGGECPSGVASNNLGGVTNPGSLGQDLIGIYEGLVALTSHIIERVADAL